jgi:hypothetical protein
MTNEVLMKLARRYTTPDGTVTVMILPFRPVWLNVPILTLQETLGEDKTGNRDIFVFFENLVLTIETTEHAPLYWRMVQDYRKKRTEDVVHDWQLFQEMCSVDVLEDYMTIFSATRQSALSAPIAIQKGVEKVASDPEV